MPDVPFCMTAINDLEAQHHALAALMLRLVNLVQGFQGPDQAYAITVHLGKLAQLLRLHLTTEDEWFYPAMLNSDEPLAASLAAAYRDEVGGIAQRLEGFLQQWNSSTVIALGFDRFRAELLSLFHQIEERIGREDKELYPLARMIGIGRHCAAAYPRLSSAAAASSTSSAMISATGSSRLTMPTDCPAITEPRSTSPSITARLSAPAQ